MVKNNKIKKRMGGKCHSPVLIHGKITTRRAGRLRRIIMWTEVQDKI